MFFVVSLDPPIKQGQTRYHFLVLLFGMEEETNIELPFTEKELKEKYDDKLTKELSGPVYEVLGKIMKVVMNRKLTGPGTFLGHSGTPAIGCSFKAAAGYLYPLERGFIYVHKPPMHIRFEEISNVNFARGGGSTKSFDFEIELKSGTQHTFSSIEKEEYGKLYDFIVSKKITVKNSGKMTSNYAEDFGDSDNEQPDAYLQRVKAEAEERDSDESGSDEESTDEDFNPNVAESDVAEEFDSNVSSSDSDAGSGSDAGKKEKKKKKEKHREKKPSSGAKKTSKKPKKDRDENAPKRATTAFMLWLNETRETIKKDNPGISFTDVAKKGGELWSSLKDKTKWEEKANKDKERYAKEMEEYKAAGGSKASGGGEKRKKEKDGSKSSPVKATSGGSGGGFKSKEYISEDESSSDGGAKNKKKVSEKTANLKS